MKRTIWIVLGWLVLGITAQAASFACAKAQNRVEHIICDNPDISQFDNELAEKYSDALQGGIQSKTIKQEQKQWLKERNSCRDAVCVKRVYELRLIQLANAMLPIPYHFQLTSGKGIAVCDAYLERLNKTDYAKAPYCDRPESDSVNGFTKLNRVPLSPADVHDLHSIVWRFLGLANLENWDWSDMKLQVQMTQDKRYKLTDGSDKSLQMSMDAGEAKIWGYEPNIDIDNDGVPDNVQVWHGTPVLGHGGTVCGDHSYRAPDDPPVRQPQIAFVIMGKDNRLDVGKTNKIFAHPMGGYRHYSKQEQRWVTSNEFRPIGKSMGIFKYQDQYFFDTFFDSWGDFENKRQSENALRNNEAIVNTLAVFLHKDGKTKQVCEYLMTGGETQNERGTK